MGVRGVFYVGEPSDRLLKGVKAITAGELWYSRKVTTELLLPNVPATEASPQWHKLTQREKEVLFELVSGANNQQIAETLCISLHTVKTHLYNIYRKIKVENHLQATLWLAKKPCTNPACGSD